MKTETKMKTNQNCELTHQVQFTYQRVLFMKTVV